jgi:hypothetical protein
VSSKKNIPIRDRRGSHCASFAGQVILAIAYGIDVAPHGDRNVEVAEKAVGAIIAGSLRGRIFDLFPFRKYGSSTISKISLMPLIVVHMPWWFPGAGFKKEAQSQWVPHVETALHAPYDTVKQQMARNLFASLQSYLSS